MTLAFRIPAVLAVPLLASLTAGPAVAQALDNDVRCFVASNMFVKAGDERSKEAAVRAGFFYLGRLRGTSAQIEAAVSAQAKTLNPQNAGTVMQACAQAVEDKARELHDVGQRLSQANNAERPKPAPKK